MTTLRVSFSILGNKIFRRIYLAETISLIGDAFTWVGLALVAYELAGENSGTILSVALTIRVAIYFLVAPFAGLLADRYDRKKIMVISHLGRMFAVGLLPFISAVWHIYGLVFLLNVLNAIFMPAYKSALVKSVGNKDDFPLANSLSSTTYQLLGILGPGVAGGLAGLVGARNIFFIDAATFLIAGMLILLLPASLSAGTGDEKQTEKIRLNRKDLKKGTSLLFSDKLIRFAVVMNFASAFAGAQILINTVGYVKGNLQQGEVQYGWAMSAFGVGATLAAFSTGVLNKKVKNSNLILLGGFIVSAAVIPASFAGLVPLMALWFVAGIGQNYVEIPVQNIIADRIPQEEQGRVYGAHFAWTHLWWAIAYPAAGLFNRYFEERTFLCGGIASLMCVLIFRIVFYKKSFQEENGNR